MDSNNQANTKKVVLRTTMEKSFSLQELEALCFDLNISFGSIAGQQTTIESAIQNLILYMDRRNDLERLIATCIKARPQGMWPGNKNAVFETDYLTPDELDSSRQREAIRAILKTCNRRAIFTLTPWEFYIDDMFSSLKNCQLQIRDHILDIADPNLQQIASDIISLLDQIQLLVARTNPRRTIAFGDAMMDQVDEIKLRILKSLQILATSAKLTYTIPRNLGSERRYFNRDEFDAPSDNFVEP